MAYSDFLKKHGFFKYIFNPEFQGKRSRFWILEVLSAYPEFVNEVKNLTKIIYYIDDKQFAMLTAALIKNKRFKVKFIDLRKYKKDDRDEKVLKYLAFYFKESKKNVKDYYDILKKKRGVFNKVKKIAKQFAEN